MIPGSLSPKTVDALRLWHDGAEELAMVEHNGIRVDVEYLATQTADMRRDEAKLVDELKAGDVWTAWRRRFGLKANLDSRTQLGVVLFAEMKVPLPAGARLTKTGVLAADEEMLLKVKHPFAKRYLQLQKLRKARSTYLEGIAREVVDGHLHPFFNLHTVDTFRSSSSDPNFQNIPIRNADVGNMVRRAFVARPGRRLIEVDFSGIEVRVAACYNKDPKLIKYICDPTTDMHRDTARDLFLLDEKQVDKRSTRDWAKNRFVFPQFYGSVWFQCAPHLWEAVESSTALVPGTQTTVKEHLAGKGVTKLGLEFDRAGKPLPPAAGTFAKQVQKTEEAFWKSRFAVYTAWKRQWWDDYQRQGYFHTLTGFTVAGDLSRNQVLNYAIQGSAFHCLLWSLVRIQRECRRRRMKTKIIGQIHDSILADVPDGEVQQFLSIAKRVMTLDLLEAWKWLIVPLDVEADVTPVNGSWADKVPWKVDTHDVWSPVL